MESHRKFLVGNCDRCARFTSHWEYSPHSCPVEKMSTTCADVITDEDSQLAHFGVLQSAFWRRNQRPSPSAIMSGNEPVQNFGPDSQSLSPYLCPNLGCSKSFMRKEHLNRHLVTHASVRPFKCNVCRRSFTRRFDIYSFHSEIKSNLRNI